MHERGDRAERACKLSPQPGGMTIASPARRVHSSGRSSPCSAGWMFSCHQVAFAPPIFVCDGIGALLIHGLDHGTGSLPRGGYRNSTAFSDSGAYTLCRSEAVKPGLSLVALPTHNGCRQASGSLRKASQHTHNVRAHKQASDFRTHGLRRELSSATTLRSELPSSSSAPCSSRLPLMSGTP